MSVVLSYVIGLLVCTVLSLMFTLNESWEDTHSRLVLNNALYSIVFLILYALGFYN